MDTKLTLKLDRDVIEAAKSYASDQKFSLSKIVENYLRLLTENKKKEDGDDIEISPLVKSLTGVIKLDKDFDHKKEYRDYLEEKYK